MSMNVYELINPSDEWTFEAPSNLIAWMVSFLVGSGQTPARRGNWEASFYMFGGNPVEDFEAQFKEPFVGAPERHANEIIVSLRSFMIKREESPTPLSGKALEERNDKHRTSINDHGAEANRIAKLFEEKLGKKE